MPSRTRKRTAQTQTPQTPIVSSHVAILQLGVSIWNQWRANEPLTRPNLRNADLSGLHLENVNLCRADLRGANLSSAYLYEADFQEADLRRADLERAGLIGANFHRATLTHACLQQTYLGQSDLSNANLKSSNLHSADLQSAILTHTILADASIAQADLTDCFDLTAVQLADAEDAHLAYFSNTLRLQIGLPPRALDPEILISTPEPEFAPVKRKQSANSVPPLRHQERRRQENAAEVFQPTRKAAANQPVLRQLIGR